ncbi:TetR/AcrR family transcriptional regulator [Faecalicatena contorta]|nr:TetR/AcrR family transcriptional regulator [Faecalicatena contorta]MBM6685616.1 TetR/AcrR family transcriptional regulator [Faecalicatena contorta]MBM6711169.1 TetR/AcrR family transcriptional regulator [Faecalicatena contorta]HIX99416.1 TetR/AcrR family transcriptional regulator [Candidatus Dorea intestinigallinarum]
MAETKDRRSVRRTKRLLKASLIDLLQTKGITKISVSELAQAADINRGTFYLHYRDIYDLLDELENDIAKDFIAISDRHRQEVKKGDIYPVLRDFLIYISENARVCLTLARIKNHNDMLRKLRKVLRESCFQEWKPLQRYVGTDVYEYYFSFVQSGYVGMLEYWLKNGMKETPEQISRMAEKIILRGISSLNG